VYLKKCLYTIIIALIIGTNIQYFKPSRFDNVTDAQRTSKEDISWRVSKTSFEFVPKGVKTTLSDIKTTQLDISQNDIPFSSYAVTSGKMQITEEKNIPQEKDYSIDAKTAGMLTINTYNFPGWKVTVDGKTTSINDQNKLKLISIAIPTGIHTVKVEFTNTPVRTFGNILTLITVLIILIIAGVQLYVRPRRGNS
jgi:hypothetical protein